VISVNKPLFKPGQVLATPGALEALEKAGQGVWEFVSRHLAGDFGIVDDEDKASNTRAIQDGSRILSAYLLNDTNKTKIWVLTEGTDDNGNRAATTILLPDEY